MIEFEHLVSGVLLLTCECDVTLNLYRIYADVMCLSETMNINYIICYWRMKLIDSYAVTFSTHEMNYSRSPKVGCYASLFDNHKCSMHIAIICLKMEWREAWERLLMQRKYRVLFQVNTNNNSKIDFPYNNNWCTVCYGDLIFDTYIIACGDPMNGAFLMTDFAQIFVVMIITLSLWFVGIICHWIILCYLLFVLRLLCLLLRILTGKKLVCFFAWLIGNLCY